MLMLTCPYCGHPADETELHPGGEAHLARVGPAGTDAEFERYMFARRNPKGVHLERWRHSYGCGKWFLAARCTVTLRVFGTYCAQTAQPPAAIVAAIREVHPDWSFDGSAAARPPAPHQPSVAE